MPSQYATIAQMQTRVDNRILAGLISDNNTAGTIADNAILNASLQDATAEFRAAALSRGSYSIQTLDALATADDPMIVRTVCMLALGYLFDRRGGKAGQDFSDRIAEARTLLDSLRDGKRALVDAQTQAAAVADTIRVADVDQTRTFPMSRSPLYPDSLRVPGG